MPRYSVSASATMNAQPHVVWDIIADYRVGHPMILPKGFSAIQVERGGIGAGTVIHFSVRTMGVAREFHQVVSTPEPGRVLVESSTTDSAITTFTIAAVDEGSHSRVEIATEMDGRPGLPGALERAMTRLVMGRMYREELSKLASFAEARSVEGRRAE